MPPEGNAHPAEVCDNLGPTWFWKITDERSSLSTAEEVVAMLNLCNRRRANCLLNVAPDPSGRIPAHSLKRLQEIGRLLDAPSLAAGDRVASDPQDGTNKEQITLQNCPGEVTLRKDSVAHRDGGVLFYHRNPGEPRVLNALLKQQGLDAFRDGIVDDLSHRTFGGLMTGEGFKQAGKSEGVYQTKEFGAWHLQSEEAAKTHHLRIVTHIDQAETLKEWQQGLNASTRPGTTPSNLSPDAPAPERTSHHLPR